MPAHRSLIPLDSEALLKKLTAEERDVRRKLSELEDQLRRFEDFERPAYEEWLRLELGPSFRELEEIHQRIHERRIFVHRLNELIRTLGVHPREALYLATMRPATAGSGTDPDENFDNASAGDPRGGPGEEKRGSWDEEEIEARRRAKLEAKREARRQEKKSAKSSKAGVASDGGADSDKGSAPDAGHRRLIDLYRDLARRLHPDSPRLVKGVPAAQVLHLWLEVQSAYAERSQERLWAIVAWLDTHGEDGDEASESPAKRPPKLSFAERYDRLRTLGRACARVEKQLHRLAAHPGWGFGAIKGSARKKLRKAAVRDLDTELAETRGVLDALEDLIESIGPPRPPKVRKR